jgi:hypothetical protein
VECDESVVAKSVERPLSTNSESPGNLAVHSYSGHAFADHPTSFEWQGQHFTVSRTQSTRRVLNSESGLVVIQFMVMTDTGLRFRLSYEEQCDRWSIEPEQER